MMICSDVFTYDVLRIPASYRQTCQFLFSNNVSPPPPPHTLGSMLPCSCHRTHEEAQKRSPQHHFVTSHIYTDEFKNNPLHLYSYNNCCYTIMRSMKGNGKEKKNGGRRGEVHPRVAAAATCADAPSPWGQCPRVTSARCRLAPAGSPTTMSVSPAWARRSSNRVCAYFC